MGRLAWRTHSARCALVYWYRSNSSQFGRSLMNGHQVCFYTTLGRKIAGKQVKDWLIALAREVRIPGVTVFAGTEGYGHHQRVHAAHFFELADEPILVVMVMSEAQCTDLFARLKSEPRELFYTVQ